VYCDGAWGSAGASAATILVSPYGIKLCYASRLEFTSETDKCTNNIAKYEAIVLGLHKLRAIDVQTCVLRTGSKLVSWQIEKECITREPTLERYLALVQRMESYFKGFTFEYIERNKNTEVDDLAKVAARSTQCPQMYFFKYLRTLQSK
jgi:ribonuclease HI